MTDPVTIASIVEGHGEVSALPVLPRRIANELFGVYDVVVPQPHRVKRSQMTGGDAVCRAARVQSARVTGRGGVLVVADADDHCAVTFAQSLRDLAKPTLIEVAVAVREFEAWFLASWNLCAVIEQCATTPGSTAIRKLAAERKRRWPP